ncbi:MAG: phosphoglucosamine mutase [Planctomycetota bacterium]
MSETIISVSGLRGIIGESLDPDLAMRYAAAFLATLENQGTIVVTRDGRESGRMLASAISSVVMAHGFDVVNADVAATPTAGVLVRELNAVGGIQISASHNPAPYNGMKLFGSDGRVISADAGAKVLDHFHQNTIHYVPFDQLGKLIRCEDATSAHLEKVLSTVDVQAIQQQKFKVVLDSNRGAGSILGRKLLEALGCEFEIMGDRPDGQFEHVPEPTADNLESVVAKSKAFGADAVFCQDPDADRLAIIDENGNYIGEEYTLAITADHRLSKSKGPVVVNCATSRMSADIAAKHGCEFVISAVGEANVTGKMVEVEAVYGGEGNGGPIDPKVGYVRDSFVAMAQVLDAMAAGNQSIGDLVAEIPKYEIYKSKISIDRDLVGDLLDKVEQDFEGADANRMDGLRLDWSDRWLLVRPSNTEPIVRAIAEAKTAQIARELCDQVKVMAENI